MYKKVNDWAKWVAINSDGYKWEFKSKPIINGLSWSDPHSCESAVSIGHDASNWQNSIIEIDAQEQEPTAWNGEGLPPVGTVCEYYLGISFMHTSDGVRKYINGDVLEVKAHAVVDNKPISIVFNRRTESARCLVLECMRPIKTEREKVIEKAIQGVVAKANEIERNVKVLDVSQSDKLMLNQLYDLDMLKLPEGEL